MMSRPGVSDRLVERRRRLGRGRWGELTACALLLAKGYRILARRHVTPYGEGDIMAARWDRLAFVEVKRRASLADAEAALAPAQGIRIARAG
jgi:putative endonuclease